VLCEVKTAVLSDRRCSHGFLNSNSFGWCAYGTLDLVAAAIPKASVLALGSQAQGKGPVVRALENLPKQIS